MADIAKQIVYSGRVQGVGFRFTCQRIAHRYELAGYVKNLPDRSVELMIQGHPEDVTACMADIADSFGAYIRDKKITKLPPNPAYTEFTISF